MLKPEMKPGKTGRRSMDYRCEDSKKSVLTPSFGKPQSSLTKKQKMQPEDTFKGTALKPGLKWVHIIKI
jgi:hypothetical protein